MSGDDDRALNDRRFHRLLLSRYGAHPARGEPSLLFNSASARSAFDIPWETLASAARFSARWRLAARRLTISAMHGRRSHKKRQRPLSGKLLSWPEHRLNQHTRTTLSNCLA